jgi:hypothetical protein
MHGLNGGYTGYFNRKYGRVGHLFQGRYRGILVEKDRYLIPLSRYVHLNPVRWRVVESPMGALRAQAVLGGEGFIERIKGRLKGKLLSREIVERKRFVKGPSPEDVISAVGEAFGVNKEGGDTEQE